MGNSTPAAATKPIAKYKIHWHILFTHFPISFFVVSFAFMVLHLFTNAGCFEVASYFSLLAGGIVMIPTTLTGWYTWKGRFKGLKSRIFQIKIWTAYAMIALSLILGIYHGVFTIALLDILHNVWHMLYFIGVTSLFVAAIIEGYFGGRLSHR